MAIRWPVCTPAWTCAETTDVMSDRLVRRLLKPAAFLASLVPAVVAGLGGAHRQSQRQPAQRSHERNRRLDAALSLHHARDHPLRWFSGWNVWIKFRRMAGLYAFFYGTLHFLTYVIADRFAGLDFTAGDCRLGDRDQPLAPYGTTSPRDRSSPSASQRGYDGAAGDHVDGRHDSPARRQTVESVAQRVYATAVLGVLHYWWLVKADVTGRSHTPPSSLSCLGSACTGSKCESRRLVS